jgi:hypothetical protein
MAKVMLVESCKGITVERVAFDNMSIEDAKHVAERMNRLNKLTAKKMGQIIKMVFKAKGE